MEQFYKIILLFILLISFIVGMIVITFINISYKRYNSNVDIFIKKLESNLNSFENGNFDTSSKGIQELKNNCFSFETELKISCQGLFESEEQLIENEYKIKDTDGNNYGGKENLIKSAKIGLNESRIVNNKVDELFNQMMFFKKQLEACHEGKNDKISCNKIGKEFDIFYKNYEQELNITKNNLTTGGNAIEINKYFTYKNYIFTDYKKGKLYKKTMHFSKVLRF